MAEQSEASGQQNGPPNEQYKIFNDSVHGHIQMHPLLVDMINTPVFQRLRNIKQMGGIYFVFPGACHNRFEHSIGVAHLAGKLLQSLKAQGEKISNKEMLCVQIAGLCHDLGHGPFSHLFEEVVRELSEKLDESEYDRIKALKNWKHEDQSVKMFNLLINNGIKDKMLTGKYKCKDRDEDDDDADDDNDDDDDDKDDDDDEGGRGGGGGDGGGCRDGDGGGYGGGCGGGGGIEVGGGDEAHTLTFTKKHIKFIRKLIKGTEGRKAQINNKSFLYEIVANKRTGIDVDKMDYISRDCLHLGMKSKFSHQRFIMFARVCTYDEEEEATSSKQPKKAKRTPKKQICMRDKEAMNMYQLFHERHMLHYTVCSHRVHVAIEMMIIDAFVAADEGGFTLEGKTICEAILDPEAYLKLTDDILMEIMRSNDPGLTKAKEIIGRITERKLYKIVYNKTFETGNLKDFKNHSISELKEIVKDWLKEIQTQPGSENGDEWQKWINKQIEENFALKIVELNYGKKEKDPIKHLRFYTKQEPNKAIKLKEEEVSYLLPKTFSETRVMLFYKGLEELPKVGSLNELWEKHMAKDISYQLKK